MKDKTTSQGNMMQDTAPYAAEAQARWGHTAAWLENQHRRRSPEEQQAAAEDAAAIFTAFAALRGSEPDDPALQALVARWQAHITAYYYRCNRQILAALGQMYVDDRRFAEHIDGYGQGTAATMSLAIAHYCQQ